MKLIVKNGSALDPQCELDEEHHSVFREKGVIYAYVLAKTDVQSGMNAFYKLQIVKHDSKEKYYVFRSWGRIGTTVGGTQLAEQSKDQAIATLEFHFMDKTGNEWKDRDRFVKKPGKYYIMELDFGEVSL